MSFCRFCGTKLEDGQICSCPEAQAVAARKAQEAAAQEAARKAQEAAAQEAARKAQEEAARKAQEAAAQEAARKAQEAAAQEAARKAQEEAAAQEAARKAQEEAAAQEAARKAQEAAAAQEAARKAQEAAAAAQAAAQANAQGAYQQAPQGGYQQQYYQQAPQGGYQQQYYQQAPQGGYQQQYYQQTPQGGYQQQYYQQAPQGGYQQQYYQQAPQGGYQQQYYQQPPKAPRKPVAGVGSFPDGIKNLLNAYKAPSTGIGKYVVSDSLWVSLIAIGTQALLSAFVVLIICGKINAMYNSVMSSYSYFTGGSSAYYNLIGAGPFFLTIAYSLIMSALLAIIIFAQAKIFKVEKINIIRCLNAAAIKAAFVSPLLLVDLIITAISPAAGMIFFYVVPLIGASIFMSHVFDACEDRAKDMKTYTFVAMVVFVILFFVLAVICWKSYIPSSLRDSISNISSISSLLGNLFN